MRVKRRMIAAEFEAVRPLLGISSERIEAARLALVEGRTLQAVGDQFGWTRQAVGSTINVVWKMWENYRETQRAVALATAQVPPGWEKATLIAPGHLLDKFRGELAQIAPQLDSKQTATTKKRPHVVKHRASKST